MSGEMSGEIFITNLFKGTAINMVNEECCKIYVWHKLIISHVTENQVQPHTYYDSIVCN